MKAYQSHINKVTTEECMTFIDTADVMCGRDALVRQAVIQKIVGADDYVRVIRCKDCLYAKEWNNGAMYCKLYEVTTERRGYCHRGC